MTDTQNNSHTLETVDSECDLGIQITENHKLPEHIKCTVNRVNRTIGSIKRKFTNMNKDLFLT